MLPVLKGLAWRLTQIALATLILASVAGLAGAHVVLKDIVQEHADTPALAAGLRQSFRARAAGMSAVEVRVAPPSTTAGALTAGRLVLRLMSDDGAQLASVAVDSSSESSQNPRFTFPPYTASAGTIFWIEVVESQGAPMLWTSSHSMLDDGQLWVRGMPTDGDLTFTTEYTYDIVAIVRDVLEAGQRDGARMLLVLALLAGPGTCLWLWLKPEGVHATASATGFAVALSMAFWAAFYAWATALNVGVTAQLLWVVVVASAAAILGYGAWNVLRNPGLVRLLFRPRVSRNSLALVLVLSIAGLLRFAHLKGIELPLWVDSVHHSALTRLIVEQGGLPQSYRPFADVDAVYYHFGFHALVAVLAQLTSMEVEQAMLVLGQVFNLLACLALYVLVARWTRLPAAGLLALALSGAVSKMPAYYVSWGRYTQLAGLVILPIAMFALSEALERRSARYAVLAGILTAGLSMVHYRILVFYTLFGICLVGAQVLRAAGDGRLRALVRVSSRAAAVGLISLAVALPWVWRLGDLLILRLGILPGRLARAEPAPDFGAAELLQEQTMLVLLGVATLSLCVHLLAVRAWKVWLVVAWVEACALAVNPSWLGGRETWVLSNHSALIALYVPLCILAGLMVRAIARLCAAAFGKRAVPQTQALLTVLPVCVAAIGAPGLVGVVNQSTSLYASGDQAALAWVRAHTGGDALFLVNARLWQKETYAGTDAGYWIPQLTGRRTTLPIVFYTGGSSTYSSQVNEMGRLEESEDPGSPEFVAAMRARGVTHVFVGAKGGPLALDDLRSDPHYRQLYESGGAAVFAVVY